MSGYGARLWQAQLLYYVDIVHYKHMQQDCDRPNDIKAEGPNVWPNQMHAVVDSS